MSPKPSLTASDSSTPGDEFAELIKVQGQNAENFYRKHSPQLLPRDFAPDEWQNPFERFDTTVHPKSALAHQAARDWVNAISRGQPRGLILWSVGYGTGKTMLAECAAECLQVMRDHEGSPQRVAMLTAPEFFMAIKDAYSEDKPVGMLFLDWCRGHFIMDDWGKQYTTGTGEEWAREQFFQIINTVSRRHGFLMTSNVPPKTIERQIGGAAYSRLLGMCGPKGIVDMSGVPDYRLRRAGFKI